MMIKYDLFNIDMKANISLILTKETKFPKRINGMKGFSCLHPYKPAASIIPENT